MTTVITAASGGFGRTVVEELLAAGTPAAEIRATSRDAGRLHDLAERGVQTVSADFLDTDSLAVAFQGAERILLVSTDDFATRMVAHGNAVTAAAASGAELIAYTSAPRADTSTVKLFADHKATERLLAELDAPYVFLRNNLYLEALTSRVEGYLAHGVTTSAGSGRLSGAARADQAAAAATVLRTDGHARTAYELGGPAFTFGELAATLAEVSGREVGVTEVSEPEYVEVLAASGLPQPMAEVFADLESGIGRGELLVDDADLTRLAGRPLTTLRQALEAALPRS